MDLRLTEDQEMVRKTVRELVTEEIVPIAAEIDETGRFPREVMEKMAAAVEAARLLAYRAALLEPKQGPDPLLPLAAIFSTDVAMDVTGKATKFHGGYGCTKDFPVGRYFRDANTLSLQPSSDYVRLQAGKTLLGVPLGPPPKAGGPPR